MDRESLIKIATECGMLVTQQSRPDATMYGSGGGIDVERFAAAVAAAVKEEDARICDQLGGDIDPRDPDEAKLCANSLAAAIRASIKEVIS